MSLLMLAEQVLAFEGMDANGRCEVWLTRLLGHFGSQGLWIQTS